MKKLTLLFVVCAFVAQAQSDLNFNTRLIDCADKWVVLSSSSQDIYAYGFVYMDASAGLTFKLEGEGKKVNSGFEFNKSKSSKFRIKPTENLVAVFSDEYLAKLNLPKVPEWLSFYKNYDADEINYRWGLTYYDWKDLKKSKKRMNALSNSFFDELDEVLSMINKNRYKGIITRVDKGPGYKQNVIRLVENNDLKLAEQEYKVALVERNSEQDKAEMAYAIAFAYYKNKNVEKFNKWLAEINRWIIFDTDIKTKAILMKEELAKL
jgi:hypothetical protein